MGQFEHCRDILERLTGIKRSAYKLAMAESVKIDLDYADRYPFQDNFSIVEGQPLNPPDVATPLTLNKSYGFGLIDQKAYEISLTRPQAHRFISAYTNIGKSRFDKTFTFAYFVAKFGFDPATLPYRYGANRRPILILTYAQWMHLVGLATPIELPDFLHP